MLRAYLKPKRAFIKIQTINDMTKHAQDPIRIDLGLKFDL